MRLIGGKKRLIVIFSDVLLILFSYWLAYLLRFNFEIPETYLQKWEESVLPLLFMRTLCFYFFGLYSGVWRYASMDDLVKILKAITLSSFLFLTYITLRYRLLDYPRSVFVIDWFILVTFVGGLRFLYRLSREFYTVKGKGKRCVLIIGAGNAGEQIVRDMKRTKDSLYLPVGFIDDDPAKRKVLIHGIKVMGNRKDIPEIVKNLGVEMAVIAMPSVASEEIRDIVSYLHKAGVSEIRIIPGTKEIMSRNISILDIKKIDLKDLLSREPIQIEYSEVRKGLEGKRVLVTGAAGSIGSELGRQIAQFKPSLLGLLDFDETELFNINQELKEDYPGLQVLSVLGDILNKEKMAAVFHQLAPQLVFHAAAYKHVPMIEDFPEEAIRVNILGTKILGELSLEFGVEKFIFVSTDKAINPTSVMGVSKRVAEMVVTGLNHQEKTQYMAVRFGNVLGSRGSVIPIFQEQIRKGGPVTITHPEMRRYFMTIPEAVLLVLQAGSMGHGGEVFVLDMGQQVKIYDVACELIRLSGLEPHKDIPIIFTGIRPGEKLFEEVLTAEEGVERTANPKIFKARIGKPLPDGILNSKIERLNSLAKAQDTLSIIQTLQEIIPHYSPNRTEPGE